MIGLIISIVLFGVIVAGCFARQHSTTRLVLSYIQEGLAVATISVVCVMLLSQLQPFITFSNNIIQIRKGDKYDDYHTDYYFANTHFYRVFSL